MSEMYYQWYKMFIKTCLNSVLFFVNVFDGKTSKHAVKPGVI